jgi:putative redox protein
MVLSQVTVVGKAEDPNYVQQIDAGSHRLLGDEPTDRGGRGAGPAPFDYLLTALGTCTSITLRMYAERKGWQLGRVAVKLDFTREKDSSNITREISISAPLSEEQRARLADIAERTPVTLAIKQGVQVGTKVSIEQAL